MTRTRCEWRPTRAYIVYLAFKSIIHWILLRFLENYIIFHVLRHLRAKFTTFLVLWLELLGYKVTKCSKSPRNHLNIVYLTFK